MKLSLFWKLMLSFALVVAIGLGAVIVIANQITNQELMSYMMGQDQGMMMGGGMGQGQGAMHGPSQMQQRTLDRISSAVLLGGGVALLAALVIGFVVFRAMTHPIDQLSHAAHSLARGDLSARVATTPHSSRLGDDELTELGATFNVMADSLQKAE